MRHSMSARDKVIFKQFSSVCKRVRAHEFRYGRMASVVVVAFVRCARPRTRSVLIQYLWFLRRFARARAVYEIRRIFPMQCERAANS